MACEYELRDSTLRVNCANCVYGASIEDFDVCLAKTIDKLMEEKKVERVVLVKEREYEYDYPQVKILNELADLIYTLVNIEKILEKENLVIEACDKCLPIRAGEIKFFIYELLRKDPIGCYVRVKRKIIYLQEKAKKAPLSCKACFEKYINLLQKIKVGLGKTALIKLLGEKLKLYRTGDRSLYREIFAPLIRPKFMLTRFIPAPPKKARLIEKYGVDGIKIEIFKLPEKARFYYFIIPPEFLLSDEENILLDRAKSYLTEHMPPGAAPERMREMFKEASKTTIRRMASEMGLSLSEERVEKLSSILTRYTVGFGILEVLLADENVQDIYVNSPIGLTPIYVGHNDFEECETNLLPTLEDAESWATRFRLLSGRPLDEANPVLDTELFTPRGRARVCAITRTLSPEGLGYALRRHRERPWTYPLFIDVKFFDPLFAGLMSFFVDGARTLLISGGRSSGKTSLLIASMLEILRRFRIITVEDTLEIPVQYFRKLGYNIERLKSRSVITRVEAEMPADEALRTAIRLGDACLIVGEVRSVEAKALFEAMRIGALSNVVAGTIHAESPYGVFDRIVNDLGVTPTSFKATDLIAVCGRLRTADGLHTYRRVLSLTEVRKEWKEDPLEEGAFASLMEYSAKEDKLKPTSTLLNGESYIINEIAKRVKEWRGNWDAVWSNIELRARIKETIVNLAKRLKRKDILEADWTVKCNEMFHLISDEVREELGGLDSEEIYRRWLEWLKKELKHGKTLYSSF